MLEISDFIYACSPDERKQMQEKLFDVEDDDFDDLPQPNKQQLQTVIRQLQAGQQVTIPEPMQLGGYLQDICIAICKYEYNDIEEIAKLIIKLTDMSAQVETKIYNEIQRQQNEFESQIEKSQFQKNEDALAFYNKIVKHFGLIISLHQLGFDSKNTKLFEIVKVVNKHLTQLASGLESELMIAVNLGTFKINWEYIVQSYFSFLYNVVLTLFTDADTKVKIPEETVLQALNTGKLNIKITDRNMLRLVEPYTQFISETHNSIQKMYSAMNFLNQEVTGLLKTRNQDNVNTIKQIAQKNTLTIKQFNKVLKMLQSTQKQIICSQVLSDQEEMELINIFYPNKSKQLHVIKAINTKLNAETLYSSNSTQAQFQFSYPVKFYKTHLEDLFNATIKDIEKYLEEKDLLQINVTDYIKLCKNDDDAELLAYLVIKRYNSDIEKMKENLYHQLIQYWDQANIYLLMRFVATIIYNGHQIEYQDEDGDKHQLIYDILTTKPKRLFGREQQYFQFINQALTYRLISTAQIFNQASSIMKAYNKAEQENRQQTFMLLIQYLHTTYEQCGIYDSYYLQHLIKTLQNEINKKHIQQQDCPEMLQLIKDMTQYSVKLEKRREQIQKEEEQREREKKEQERLAKLQKTNPKQYAKIIKRKQEERVKLEKQKELEELEKQKKLEQKQKQPKYELVQDILKNTIKQLQQYDDQHINDQQLQEIKQIMDEFVDKYSKLNDRIIKHQQQLQENYEKKQEGGAIIKDQSKEVPIKLMKYLLNYLQMQIDISTINQLKENLLYSRYIRAMKYDQNVEAQTKLNNQIILCKLMVIETTKGDKQQKLLDLEILFINYLKLQLNKQTLLGKQQYQITQDSQDISDESIDILLNMDQRRNQNDGLTIFIKTVQQCIEEQEQWIIVDQEQSQQMCQQMQQLSQTAINQL